MINVTTYQGNANQATMRYHLTPVKMATLKEKKKQCWQGCGEIGTLATVGRNVKWCSCYGKQYGGFSKKLKIEIPYDPVIVLLSIY